MDHKLISGTVEMLILDILARYPSYGYQITQQILKSSKGEIELKEGSLYPALHRLERQKLLSSYWVDTKEGRRRKYYRITAKGQKVLETKRKQWQQFSISVGRVLKESNELA